MTERKQTKDVQQNKEVLQKNKPAPTSEQTKIQAKPGEFSGSLIASTDPSIQSQAARFSDRRFQTVQRQMMAAHIGQVGGNQYLQSVLSQLKQGQQTTESTASGPEKREIQSRRNTPLAVQRTPSPGWDRANKGRTISRTRVQREDEPATSTGTQGDPGTLTIQLPRPLDLSVNGIGVSGPTLLLEGPTGSRVDINPYTGNMAIDFPLAMLEAMGIPVLSYFYFHHGSARPYLGRRIRHLSGLSGGTSFIRNAIHYGYITADDVDLYGAPSSFNEEHYQGLPNLNIHANPYDIGTMIDFTAFNNPTMDNPNVPTVVFRLSMPFDQNPLEAFKNLGGAVYYMFSGEMYSRPGETHNYPDFRSSRP